MHIQMSVVDAHLHVNFHGFSARSLVRYMNKEKIDCCWLLTWDEVNPELWPYQHLSVEDIFEAYLNYPSRIIPFYAPDPHRIDATFQLENWFKLGVRGCGELKATLNWNSDEVKSLLPTIQRLKLPVVFHMEESRRINIPYSNNIYDKLVYLGLKTERKLYQVPRRVLQTLVNSFVPLKKRTRSYIFPGYMLDFASLETTLREYQGINFIAHGPMFWKNISADALSLNEQLPAGPVSSEGVIYRLLRDYPNLHADISGASGLNALTRDCENAKRFLEIFRDKILYGTDNVMISHQEFLSSLGLSKSTYKKIYGENAVQLLNT
jgi:hypothetical protein